MTYPALLFGHPQLVGGELFLAFLGHGVGGAQPNENGNAATQGAVSVEVIVTTVAGELHHGTFTRGFFEGTFSKHALSEGDGCQSKYDSNS